MGLRWVTATTLTLLLVSLVPATEAGPGSASAVLYEIGSGQIPQERFPHPALCVGPATNERHRDLEGRYHLDPDGCRTAKATAAYLDEDGNGEWGVGDVLVVRPGTETTLSARHLVADGADLRPVTASDRRAGRDVGRIPGAWDFVDRDGDGRWSAGDVAYLDHDASGHLTPGDVRLDETLSAAWPGQVGMSYPLQPTTARLCFVDDDGDRSWQTDESTYLVADRECDRTQTGDLRLSDPFSGRPGRPLGPADRDVLWLLDPLPATGVGLRGAYAILDLDASGDETKQDFRFSDARPGFVGLAATGAMIPEATGWTYLDLDGAEGFGAGDVLYLDRDQDGHASVGDIRFAPLFGLAAGRVVQSGEPDDVTRPDPTRAADRTNAATPATNEDQAKDTPGPALAVLLAALFAAAASHRPRPATVDRPE